MKATAEWGAKECEFGKRAELAITVENDSDDPVLIHRSTVRFSRTNKEESESHSIRIGPHERRLVWKVSVVIGPWAERAGATGTLRIAYQAKRGSDWGNQETGEFPQDSALTITDARLTGRRIFISHTNRDRDRAAVKAAARAVRKLGFEPYVSEEDPRLGDNLWRKILEEVRRCDGLIFLLTEDGAESCDMREELGYARMRNAMGGGKAVKIVPIVEEGVDPSGSFKGDEYKRVDLGRPKLLADHIASIIIDSFAEEG